jgi:hypothetical protein
VEQNVDDIRFPNPVPAVRETEDAMAYLDRVVTEVGGIVLRYGGFHGDPEDPMIDAVRSGKFPMVGRCGCRSWPGSSARSLRATSRSGWPGSSRARRW